MVIKAAIPECKFDQLDLPILLPRSDPRQLMPIKNFTVPYTRTMVSIRLPHRHDFVTKLKTFMSMNRTV